MLQRVHSNYEIDLFQHLIKAAAAIVWTRETDFDIGNKSLRVIADHIRACSFLIVDGVLPSNEGRGYVVRRIIRRAVRHFWKLGALSSEGQFWRMVQPLVETMGDAYPELRLKRGLVEAALKAEEAAFATTLDAGMLRLDSALSAGGGKIDGEQLFQLHDTYGCPPDLIADILREKNAGLTAGADAQYEELMGQQRERARSASKFAGTAALPSDLVAALKPSEFLGYDAHQADDLVIVALLREGRAVESLTAGEQGTVILDRTPFYAESGGQVGDRGELVRGDARFDVSDTHKLSGAFHGHIGTLASGTLRKGDRVAAAIDSDRRTAIVLNHSATHLLHAALRNLLGEHVQQKGSLVAPDRLRFDFSHFQPIPTAQLAHIEALVNAEIRRNVEVEVHQMNMQEALDFGAMALFGEKYGERVRVLRMGEFSTELCGGTHVARTGDIGLFKIISEGGVAAGVRRIEAVTGQRALEHVAEVEQRLAQLARLLGGSESDAIDKLRQLLDRQKKLDKELESIKARATAGAAGDLAASAQDIGGIKLVVARLEGVDARTLRDSIDQLKQKLGDAVIVLASAADGRAALVAGVHGVALERIKAGELLGHIAAQIGGKGGGRADMAQGGGEDGPALRKALDAIPAWLAERLR